MFSQLEIFEDFVEATRRASDWYPVGDLTVHKGAGFTGDMRGDAAAKFLSADEPARTEMRQAVRVIPKDQSVGFLRSGSGPLSVEDAAKVPTLLKAYSGRELARRMRVSHTTIQRIMKGQWRK